MTNPKYLAPQDSPYVLQNPDGLPIMQLIQETLPLSYEQMGSAVAVEGTEEEGYSAIYRNKASKGITKTFILPELDTYAKVVDCAVEAHAERPCMAYREYDYQNKVSENKYTSISFKEVDSLRKSLGSGLLYLLQNSRFKNAEVFESHRKIDNHERDFRNYNKDDVSFVLTLFAPNRHEWIITDLMCINFAITNTALYDTLGPKASSFILSSTHSPVVFASKANVDKVIQLKEENPDALGDLILLVSLDPLFQDDIHDIASKKRANDAKIDLYDFNQLIELGKLFPHPPLNPTARSLYTLSFTSGTTGSNPKGVMIPHSMASSGITYVLTHLPHSPGRKSFAFLPLAHIFERQVFSYCVISGGCVGFPQHGGSPLTLVEDLKLYKPDQLANVPRVFTKFEAAIKSKTIDNKNELVKRFFESVFDAKIKSQGERDGSTGSQLIYDNTFLRSIRKSFGFDNVDFVISGSAPISVNTVKFLRAAFKIGIIEGYGLTESFAAAATSVPLQAKPGSVGPVGVTCEMRLRELPDMNYTLQDEGGPRGELLLRGIQIFDGYYKDEEQTKSALSPDGWFSTGDVAKVDPETGRLYIIDRVKNFFKLAQGEYVSPEKVENVYLSSNSSLTQCFAYGISTANFLVAILGVDVNIVRDFLISKCNVSARSLVSDDDVLKSINSIANKTKFLQLLNSNVSAKGILQGFEKLHNIFIDIEPLRPEREVVTTTLKLRRPVAAKYFSKEIEGMYKEGSLVLSEKL